jgi:hypothetical protein
MKKTLDSTQGWHIICYTSMQKGGKPWERQKQLQQGH